MHKRNEGAVTKSQQRNANARLFLTSKTLMVSSLEKHEPNYSRKYEQVIQTYQNTL
jgi:hypothetical protein